MGKKSSAPQGLSFNESMALADKQSAASQAMVDKQTQANRPTQITPWGTNTWSQDAQGNWTNKVSLSGAQQGALDDQMAIQAGKSDLAQGMLGRVGEATAKPFSTAGMMGWGQGGQAGQGMMANAPQAGKMQMGMGNVGNIQTQMGNAGKAQGTIGPSGQIQRDVEGEGLAARQRVEEGLMGRLAPQQARETAALETKLAGMGLQRGSAAWKRESEKLADTQQRAQLGVLQQGLAEQQGQFGMNLQAGQFSNQAQAQQEAQLMGRANLANQAQQQNYGQMLQNAQFGNQAQQQQYQQALQNAQFGNQAQAQQYQQALQGGQFQNQAQAQRFQQQMQQSQYQNQTRQQQIAEQQQMRSMPLNELNALMTGSQVGSPQFGGFQNAGLGQGPNYLQAQQQSFQQGMDVYGANQAQQQGMMSGLGSLAGMAMQFMPFSDVRLKSNIVKVGDHPIGVGVYEYDIFDRRERGVIAQELQAVAPHLVHVHPSGYLMVDYGGL